MRTPSEIDKALTAREADWKELKATLTARDAKLAFMDAAL